MAQNETFYGYKNHATMEIALTIQNDALLKSIATADYSHGWEGSPYSVFREVLREAFEITQATDAYTYSHSSLDIAELDEVITDIQMED